MQNYLPLSFSQVKRVRLWGALFIGCILLSGCANVMHRLGYVPIPAQQVSNACSSASVLITNLKDGAHRSAYQLPNGRICLEIHDDKNKQEQQPKTD